MEQKKTLLVGMDLDYDVTQIVCCAGAEEQPAAVVFSETRAETIPTAIGVEDATKKWMIGPEMEAMEEEKRGETARDLLHLLLSGEPVKILTAEFAPQEIMERFLRRCLLQVREQMPGQLIASLIVCLPDTSEAMREKLGAAFAKLGLMSDRVKFISRGQSFGEYVLKRRKELLSGTAALFDYRPEGMQYRQVRFQTRRRPVYVELLSGDLSDVLPYKEGFDYADAFAETAAKLFNKQTVLRVYATGRGFGDQEQAAKALGKIARGRKVFLGDNLYVQGACCYAQRLAECGGNAEAMSRDYLILAEETSPYEVNMDLFYRGRTENIVVLEPGVNWYDVEKSFDFILDDTDHLDLTVVHALTGEKTKESFYLDGLEKRPRKMTRVRVRFDCPDVQSLRVQVRDLGFGEWYPATDMTWEFSIGGASHE